VSDRLWTVEDLEALWETQLTSEGGKEGRREEAMSGMDVTAPGRELHARFLALGDMTGRTADEIVAVVGRPSSISSMAFGQTLLQWQAIGCHMALLFDADGRFVKITHQYAQYARPPAGCMSIVAILFVILVTIAGLAIRG
jgi:hypothetical protein